MLRVNAHLQVGLIRRDGSPKLMNEIESDTSGEIVKVLVNNGQPVEYGQPLFAIRPRK